MPRIRLVPVVTADGRHIVLQAIRETPRETVRRLAERLRPKRGAAKR
jgi:hypothetical protein